MSVHATPAADNMETSTDESTEELTKDEVFHILQTQRRRDALRYLKDHDNPVEMRDMAEQVAAWENDTTVQALTSAERQRVYIALYQSHLPKLDREGIIDYNQSRGIVRREPLMEQFDPYLDETDTDEADEATATADAESNPEPAGGIDHRSADSEDNVADATEPDAAKWLAYYHAMTFGGALVVAASLLGLPVASSLPDVLLGAAIVAAFALVSVAQTLDHHRSS